MGKIRQLREDQIVNGGSQEHIYPVTYTKAVYSKDRQNLQDIIDSIREGNFLKDGSIKTRHLKDKAVTTSKLDDGSVDNRVLAIDAVTYDKLKDKSVITEKLNDRAGATEKVEEKAITNPKLGNQSVDGRVVREASLETKHLANESVTTDKIRDDCVNGRKIQKGTIELYHLSAMLASILKAAIGLPEDLINQMTYLYKKINEIQPISEDDIDKITEGSYVPEQTNPTPSPDSNLISYVKAIDVKVTDTGKKLDQFIASDLTTEQVNDLLDKQNDNINI